MNNKRVSSIICAVLTAGIITLGDSSGVFAAENNNIKIGDADKNGSINALDAVIILRNAMELDTLDGGEKELADANFDGAVNTLDAALILQRAAGIIGDFIHPDADSSDDDSSNDTKVLVAYFSWSGNTEDIAEYIAEQTDGDIFEIVPVTPYPEEYTPATEVALAERDDNARPAIQNLPSDISEYDTVFVGYPIWWHTAPMIIGTFLENYDFSEIEIYPFTQSASMDTEQFNNSMEFVRECAKDAEVHDGLFAGASDKGAIDDYLNSNGF